MSSKTCLTVSIACCFVFFSATASAWSLYDTLEMILNGDRQCEVLTATSDDQSSSKGEGKKEEEPDCE